MSPPTSLKPQYSLQKRLVFAFGILLILFLGLAGLVLDRAFEEGVITGVEERLQLQIYAVLGVAEIDESGFFLPDLEEARFAQIDSGLYGFILDSAQKEVWRSPSALNVELPNGSFVGQVVVPGQTNYGLIESVEQGDLAYASYGTYWADQEQMFSFVVMESIEPIYAEINQFQSGLWFGLAGLAIVLAIAQYFLLRWSLRPLQILALDVAKIESGQKDQLDGIYPAELQTVSNNLNLLIKSERERQTRYRTTLGDLAHSLKTPLAVIFGIVESKTSHDEHKEALEEQIERMNQIISYQLKRAIEPKTNKMFTRAVNVTEVFNKIISALEKVYRDKAVALKSSLQADTLFYGDESDLMELCGNLLDNAFKYCKNNVLLKVSQQEKKLRIEISDDGNGIAKEDRHWVLERGARVDTIKSGQGIGLAVSVDIISSYGGSIKVARSDLGGASIIVEI